MSQPGIATDVIGWHPGLLSGVVFAGANRKDDTLDDGILTALEMATINTAEYYRVNARIGSIAPGRSADLLLVEDLRDFHPSMVITSGRVVGDDRAPKGPSAVPALPASLISSVSLAAPIEAATFRPAARP